MFLYLFCQLYFFLISFNFFKVKYRFHSIFNNHDKSVIDIIKDNSIGKKMKDTIVNYYIFLRHSIFPLLTIVI